jgi:hypothetical protein
MRLSFDCPLLLLLVLVFLLSASLSHARSTERCSPCKTAARRFKEEMEKTRKGNFGGGNSEWESKALGEYVTR